MLRLQPPDLAESIDSPDFRPIGHEPSRAACIIYHQENNRIWFLKPFGVDRSNFYGPEGIFRCIAALNQIATSQSRDLFGLHQRQPDLYPSESQGPYSRRFRRFLSPLLTTLFYSTFLYSVFLSINHFLLSLYRPSKKTAYLFRPRSSRFKTKRSLWPGNVASLNN